MIKQILSFLSPVIPVGLAVKGLEKINPKMKSFFSGAAASGYGADQALSFLREQFSTQGNKEVESQGGSLRPDEQAAQSRMSHEKLPSRIAQGLGTVGAGLLGGSVASGLTQSTLAATQQNQGGEDQLGSSPENQSPMGFEEFIRQHPELGSYLDELILKKGLSPQQAGVQAKKNRKFGPLIQSIEDKVGQPFEGLLSQLFEGFKSQQPKSEQGNQPAQGKTQFLQGLQQLGGLLQGLTGR